MSTRRKLMVALVGLAVAFVALGGAAALLWRPAGDAGAEDALIAGIVLVALLVVSYLYEAVNRHFRFIDRLRGAVVHMAGDPGATLPRPDPAASGAELEDLRAALADLAAEMARERAAPDARLQAILASRHEAIVVVTEQGQVSLVNHAAKELLGAERVAVGTSVFAALLRDPLLAALDRSLAAGHPVPASLMTLEGRELQAHLAELGEHGGAVICIPEPGTPHRAELECDLGLHDQPPPPRPIAAATPLDRLPVLVLDCETTGLEVARDRVVSVGAVRLDGVRLFRSATLDSLVNPGIPIPGPSTAIHGITDAMVADAGTFEAVFEKLRALQDGTVMVGHNVPFDIAMIARECGLAGIDWDEPPFLDTLLLAGALDPRPANLDLEGLAEEFAVRIRGRHTALGDALVTAQVYQRLVPRLAEIGVTTFGEALAHSRRARAIVRQQKAMGW
jgi:DNA polymerase-3 subunit epsilon